MKSVKWNEDTIQGLKDWYVENDVPSDTLIKNQDAINEFTRKFNARLDDLSYTDKEVATKLLSLRKSGKLPRIRK